MSLWKRIFGRNFEDSVAYAEDLLGQDRPGEAKLELESALSKGKDAPEARLEHVRELIATAKERLARQHIEESRNYAADGNLERAYECFETALEVGGEEVRAEVQKAIDAIESEDARAAFEEEDEMTDAERYQILSGAWDDDRADELETYGEAFASAFLKLHDGEAEAAVTEMKELLQDNPDALYLRLELGLAQRAAGQFDAAAINLKAFLADIEEEEDERNDEDDEDDENAPEPLAAEARVQAHATLAEVYLEADDPEAAEEELRTLVDLLPDKSGPYVHLGAFLRERDRNEEALKVLQIGQRFMGQMRPDMRVVRELGLTYRALGDDEAAIDSLNSVIEFYAKLRDYNFDPITAVPLAELYEETGKLDRATDLYRHLAAGSHAAGHFRYNRDAGRLLAQQKDHALAHKHLTRALELAPDDEAKAEVQALIDELPSPA